LRRFAIAFVFIVACRGEQRTPEPAKPAQQQPPAATTSATPAPPPVPVKISSRSKCAGDGSYQKAVDCFRIASHLHFVMEEPLVSAEGELTRPRLGLERVQFRASGGEWVGEVKPEGLVWTRDGKHDTNPPAFAERIYQRVATYVDPQKKEGKAQLAGTDLQDGEPYNIYRFTSVATGAASEVWVSMKDGRMLRIKVTPLPQLADTSPEYTLELD
jgi:hypothetical protein